MKIVYVVQRIGPYHNARFKETRKRLASSESELIVVEIAKKDADYQWDVLNEDKSYRVERLFEKPYDIVSGIELYRELVTRLNMIAPDVIFIPGWSSKEALLSLIWSKFHKVSPILLSDSSEFDFKRVGWKEYFKKNIIKQFKCAFVAGNPQKEYLVKLGFSPENIELGYDVVDNKHFELPDKSSYEYNGYFLASGRFIKRKNFVNLILAYKAYRERVISPRELILCGSGEERSEIEKTIAKYNLESFVKLPGFIQYKDLPKYYHGASVFIIPSVSEQWGLVINEAMASGLPILASNKCGATQDLVKSGKNGLIFNPIHVEEMAGKLIEFHKLPSEIKTAYSNEAISIISNWTTDSFANSISKIAKIYGNE